VDFSPRVVKHRCTRCGLVRIKTEYTDRFPTARYTDAAGVMFQGKAPSCA
jgi:hypothetical protein